MKIDKNITIPPKKPGAGKKGSSGRKRKYPLDTMEIGDSFLFPFREGKTNQQSQAHITTLIRYFTRKHPENKFTTRILNDGIRVWKIK